MIGDDDTVDFVIMRHAESEWNAEDRFTGWQDVPLSDHGVTASRHAARLLQQHGFTFDYAYSSALRRSIKTMWLVLEEMRLEHIPEVKTWRLNEKMYGQLQGEDKTQSKKKYGGRQVQLWRRSYDIPPPPVETTDPRFPAHDPKYKDLDPVDLPRSECLSDILKRTMPLWDDDISIKLRSGKRVIVIAHGSNVRVFMKILCQMSDEECSKFESDNGVPLIFKLRRSDLQPVRYYFLRENSPKSRL